MPKGFNTKHDPDLDKYKSFGGPGWAVLGVAGALTKKTTLGSVTLSAAMTFNATSLTYSAKSGITCDLANKLMDIAYNPANGLVYLILVDDTIDTMNIRCTGIYLEDFQCPGEKEPSSPDDDMGIGDELIVIGNMYDFDAVDTNDDPIWNAFEMEGTSTYTRSGDSQKHKSMGQTVKTVVGQLEQMVSFSYSEAWRPEVQKFIDQTAKMYVTIAGKVQAIYIDKAGSIPDSRPLLLLDAMDVAKCSQMNDDGKPILDNSRFFGSVEPAPGETEDFNTDGSQRLWTKEFTATPNNVFESVQIHALIAWRLTEWPTDI